MRTVVNPNHTSSLPPPLSSVWWLVVIGGVFLATIERSLINPCTLKVSLSPHSIYLIITLFLHDSCDNSDDSGTDLLFRFSSVLIFSSLITHPSHPSPFFVLVPRRLSQKNFVHPHTLGYSLVLLQSITRCSSLGGPLITPPPPTTLFRLPIIHIQYFSSDRLTTSGLG